MKPVYFISFIAMLAFGCQPAADHNMADSGMRAADSVKQVFDANSATIQGLIRDFLAEHIDHSAYYADTAKMANTQFGATDTLMDLAGIKKHQEEMWAAFDFGIVGDSINLLPGVNADTRETDGSVRFYTKLKVTRAATDSSDERVAVVPLYESFDFNSDGKIIYQQYYGDFSGAMGYLMAPKSAAKKK